MSEHAARAPREAADPPDPRDAAMARWWTRNRAGREFSAIERRFLGDAARMLDDLAPRQVDPALCAVTASGQSTLIALIPHRSLGGLALAITVTDRFATLSWASVHDLATHDDLDLTREVYLFARDGAGDDMWREAVAGLRTQLSRPIVLEIRSTKTGVPLSASCYLADASGRRRRIARLPPRAGWARRVWPWARTTRRDISFLDVAPPPYTVAARAASWFRGA